MQCKNAIQISLLTQSFVIHAVLKQPICLLPFVLFILDPNASKLDFMVIKLVKLLNGPLLMLKLLHWET